MRIGRSGHQGIGRTRTVSSVLAEILACDQWGHALKIAALVCYSVAVKFAGAQVGTH